MIFKSIKSLLVILLSGSVLLTIPSCNYLDKQRTIKMKCSTEPRVYVSQAKEIFERNGYSTLVEDYDAGVLVVQDSVERIEWRYSALVRTWRIEHSKDSVFVDVWSVSTRLDGSDVRQTWDKRWSGEDVKEWMRPIMISLESACGLGNPLAPSP
ncbi:MAG: hypothetical protein HQ472_07385 [Ignavibacteria bacterium]|nr:hypothetical protein [Ignavibacteria bacterium]